MRRSTEPVRERTTRAFRFGEAKSASLYRVWKPLRERMQSKPLEALGTHPLHAFRRDPKQARSRALIDAILEAVNRLTADHELQISTKRIAEVAGVSIGSLYQYFPSKDSLLGTWWQSVVRSRVLGVLQALEAGGDQPLSVIIERMVDHAIAARADNGSERALLRAYQLFGNNAAMQAADQAVVQGVAQLLRDHQHETRQLDHELSAFLMVFAVRWILYAAAYVPGLLEQPRLRDELVHLLVAYVAKR